MVVTRRTLNSSPPLSKLKYTYRESGYSYRESGYSYETAES